MNIIKAAIHNPVSVIVGVLLLILFGTVSLQRIPVQLAPRVERPVITVNTLWPGATPYEIERDIIEEQEKVLKGIPNLYELESTSQNSRGQVTLRFDLGTNIDNALLRVSNKLSEVRMYPENVERPVIEASGAESSPVMWVVLKAREGNDRNIYTYLTYFENEVRQYFERVDGVASLFLGGGTLTQQQILVRPERLAAYGLTVTQVITALRNANVNISAGNLPVGRYEYRIRTVAEFRSDEDIRNVVVLADGEREVRVGDLAEVRPGFAKLDTPMISNFEPGISIGIRPEPNTNVLNLTDAVERVVNELNEGKLQDENVYLDIVNEQRPYIRGAIALLQRNIFIGGVLALCVLLIFLRSIAPTLVVSAAIPISIIGTFIFMGLLGSTLNVVSLAGIAFAVGMLVDNAIVVLENIDRHRGMGKTALAAAYDATAEVWGAVLASSLTTVAVFLPVVFLEDEAGQLFRDIALAVSVAVSLSLITSMTVIPSMSQKLFQFQDWRARHRKETRRFRAPNIIGRLGTAISGVILRVVGIIIRNWATRLVTIVVLAGGAVTTSYLMMPKMEYLPQGNRDLIINVLIAPPGLSYEERYAIGDQLYAFFKPYFRQQHDGYPPIRNMFYVGRGTNLILGVVSEDQARTPELLPLCREAIASIPGIFGVSNQASIFQSGLGQGRTITVDLSGGDINRLVSAAGVMMGMVREEIPESQTRPVPSLDMLFPEVNFVPSRERLRAVGMSEQDFGISMDVLMDGRDIGDYKQEGQKKVDLVVKVDEMDMRTPEQLNDALIATPRGGAVPVSSLATLERSTGLTEIRHYERNRTVSLQITPPYSITIQEAMERVENNMVPALREQGLLGGIDVTMSGTADRLTETRQALQWNFVLAAVICYLLMSALLGNFIYPIVIMLVVPMAGAGGFVGLKLVNLLIAPQQMDILTMLGFIILVGIVVNNPILIVYQSLNNVRYNGMDYEEAVIESVRTRLRPIYMSATTSLFGMLPLVLWPGPGSELYRGLGSVVLGGLAFSTLFTVFLIPPMLMFFIKMEHKPETKAEPLPVPVP